MSTKTAKQTTKKAAPKKPRMSKSAARAEGAQRTGAARFANAGRGSFACNGKGD